MATKEVNQEELARVLADLSRVLGGDGAELAEPNKSEPQKDQAAGGLEKLTAEDVELQQVIFNHFDTDNTGQLAQGETVRMLKAMQLFDTTEEVVGVIKEMDEDNSGTIDFDEYIEYIDRKCSEEEDFYRQYRVRSRNTKLGYDGTTWRKHANITWITNQGIMILTVLAFLGALIYFRFILVPMTMAYFLTFLLGPVQDLLIQRPLVCCNLVCCDKPGFIRPALRQQVNCCGAHLNWYEDEEQEIAKYETPRARWDEMKKDSHLQWDGHRMIMHWEDEGTGCCYAIPPPQWSSKENPKGGGAIRNSIYNFFMVMKIPEVLSVLVTLVLTGALLAATFIVISAELVSVVDDPAFQEAKAKAVVKLNSYLAEEHKMAVKELVEMNSTNDEEIVMYDQDEIGTLAGPYIMLINEAVTTLLLCMYMLSTREPEAEEETYKEVQSMTLFEKIKSKVKFYVVLKTALSALTGGLVGVILLLCKVRLAMLFALLAFILNFIPNVGSMIATVLPIPLILLDEVEDDFAGRKALAILLPACVQGYVGNVLEPVLFGKSLNVTAISVLVSLVLWGSIWGIQGAILSVPLLAAMKVALEDTDHPMAKMVLRVVRESASIDDALEATKSRKQKQEEKRKEQVAVVKAAARWEGLISHDVIHGAKLKNAEIRHKGSKDIENPNPLLEDDLAPE